MHARRFLTAVVLLTCFLAADRASSQAICDCDPMKQVEAYLRGKGPARVLVFDHVTQRWAAFQWNGVKPTPIPAGDLESAFSNKPLLFVEKRTQPTVLVVNTNPMLFNTVFSGATEAPIEDLANLQRLATLLGGVLSAEVALLPPGFRPQEAQEGLAAAGRAMREPTLRAAADDKLWEPASSILEQLESPADEITKALNALRQPRNDLEAQLQSINEINAEIRSYLQLIESRSPSGIEPRPNLAVNHNSQPQVEASFDKIADARKALQKVEPVCPGTLAALRDAVRLFRTPLAKDKLPEKRAAVDGFLKALDGIKEKPGCGTALDRPILEIKSRLIALHDKGNGPPSESGATAAQDRALRPLVEGLGAYLTLIDQRVAALKATDELMAKRGDGAKVAGTVHASLLRRAELRKVSEDPCFLIAGVVEVRRPGSDETDLRWGQIRSESFKIVADSPYKDLVTLNHPTDVTAGYDLQQAGRWNFDVDVATIYTEIADPVYTAVDPDTNPDNDNNVIGQTDEKGRAGELGLFVTFKRRINQGDLFTFGPQIGAGFSTDHPAFFAGFGIGISRYAKLGFGWSWQRIKALKDAETGDPVAATEDISTRDVFKDNYYVSLSITLDEMPFFNAPDE
jgi:hypothetical protein